MKQRHRKHRRPVRWPALEIGMRRRVKKAAEMAKKYRPYAWAIERRLPSALVHFDEIDYGRNIEICVDPGGGREQRFLHIRGPLRPSMIPVLVAMVVDPPPQPA